MPRLRPSRAIPATTKVGGYCGFAVTMTRGAADIQTAIRLNPSDQAAAFEAWPKAPLSEAAMRHGQRQVALMLKDRPIMGQFGKGATTLYRWAAQICRRRVGRGDILGFHGAATGRCGLLYTGRYPPLHRSAKNAHQRPKRWQRTDLRGNVVRCGVRVIQYRQREGW